MFVSVHTVPAPEAIDTVIGWVGGSSWPPQLTALSVQRPASLAGELSVSEYWPAAEAERARGGVDRLPFDRRSRRSRSRGRLRLTASP